MPLSNQDVAIVAVCIAGIILAGIFAPGVISIISSVVSTLVGAFFVNRSKGSTNQNDAEARPATVLKLVQKKSSDEGDAS